MVGGRGPAGQAVEPGDRFDEADEAIKPRAVFRGLTGAEEAVCPCVIVERIETVIEIELTRDIGSLRVEIVAEGREVLVDHAHLVGAGAQVGNAGPVVFAGVGQVPVGLREKVLGLFDALV